MAQILQDALKDIQIVDLTRLLPGPLATDILASYGATIYKIELKGVRYDTKQLPPFKNGVSTLYVLLNHRKKVYQIDLESDDGRKQLNKLIQHADVIIEQFRPGFLVKYGLDAKSVQALNDQIIYISLTGYGQTGSRKDWPGHDINFMAESGLLDMNRSHTGQPIIPAVQIADIVGGSYQLIMQCMAAIIGKKYGAVIDIAMLDGVKPLVTFPLSQINGGMDPHQFRLLSGGLVNYNVYQCANKEWVALGALELKFWNRFCDLVNKPTWKREDIISLQTDHFNKDKVDELFQSKTVNEWVSLNEQHFFCLSKICTLKEVAVE